MSKNVQPASSVAEQASDSDRRGEVRHDAAKLGQVRARLIGGSEVTLVNFSNRGVLFESDSRLLIGARASVRLTTTDANLVVTGRVVRSRVKGVVNGALRYDAALALDGELSLAIPETPIALPEPCAEPAAEPLAADGGPVVEGAELGPVAVDLESDAEADALIAVPGAPAVEVEDGVLQLYASVPHDLAELRRIAADNQW